MGSLKALALAGVAAVGAMNIAQAADLLPPPPPIEQPAPVDFNGWYLRGDVGVGVNTVSQQHSTFATGVFVDNPQFSAVNIGTSAIFGIGGGYQFNNWFRADVTGEYRTFAHYNAHQSFGPAFCFTATGRCTDGYSASIGSAVFLANGYVDLGTWYGVTPYVGAGVGVADTRINGLTDVDLGGSGASGIAADKSSTHLAWALMAGLSYSLTPNLKLDFGYRYLNLGTASSNPIVCNGSCTLEVQKYQLASHDVRIGIRYLFADAFVPAPPLQPLPPLIRKY